MTRASNERSCDPDARLGATCGDQRPHDRHRYRLETLIGVQELDCPGVADERSGALRFRKTLWPSKQPWMSPTTGRFLATKATGGTLKGVRREK